MMNKECNLITPENIQRELINNEIEQINLRTQAFKEQKYNELLKENKDLQQRIDKAIEITNKILMNNADNRMVCNDDEKEYFDWLDSEMLKQEKILGGKE